MNRLHNPAKAKRPPARTPSRQQNKPLNPWLHTKSRPDVKPHSGVRLEAQGQRVEREDKWDDAMNENKQLQIRLVNSVKGAVLAGTSTDEVIRVADANTINHLKAQYDEAKTNMAR